MSKNSFSIVFDVWQKCWGICIEFMGAYFEEEYACIDSE
jgi:hypothetical protein